MSVATRTASGVAFAVVAMLLAACGERAAPAAGRGVTPTMASSATEATELRFAFDNLVYGAAAYTLRCTPPSGTLPDPASVCARLRRNPAALGQGTTGTPTGPPEAAWTVRITGIVDGVPVNVTQDGPWGGQLLPVTRALGLELEQVVGRMGRGVIELDAPPLAGAGQDPGYWIEVAGPRSSLQLSPSPKPTRLTTPPGRITVRVSRDQDFRSGPTLCRVSFTQPRDTRTRLRVWLDQQGRCRIPQPVFGVLPPGTNLTTG